MPDLRQGPNSCVAYEHSGKLCCRHRFGCCSASWLCEAAAEPAAEVAAGCAEDPAYPPSSDGACLLPAEAAKEAGETPQEAVLKAVRMQKARIAWKDLTSTLGAAEGRQRIRAQQQQAAKEQLQAAVEVRQRGGRVLVELIWGPW